MLKKFVAGFCVSAAVIAGAYAQDTPRAPAAADSRPGGVDPAAGRGADPNLLRNLPTPQQWNSNPVTQRFVAQAKAIAGTDPDLKFDFATFCKPSGGSLTSDRASIGVPEGAPYAPYGSPNPAVRLPAQHMFENFWWLGDTGVGSWLITTPAGYILFDASNNAKEAQEVIIDAMKKAGLDPSKIKYMVFGHFHLDHTGGGHLIQSLYHPKVIMGRDDWDLYFKTMENANSANPTGQGARIDDKVAMTRGIDATDGMKISLGGTTATIYLMPGHTPGSIGMVVPVKWQGKPHNILIVTAATDFHNADAFVGGYEHIWDLAEKAKVEAVYQVHPNTNMNLLARVKYTNENFAELDKPGGKNPLLYGIDKTHRYIEIMRSCSRARIAALGW